MANIIHENVIKEIKFTLCLINYAPHPGDVYGSGRTDPEFLILAPDGGGW